jgi:hypothetical protein
MSLDADGGGETENSGSFFFSQSVSSIVGDQMVTHPITTMVSGSAMITQMYVERT